MLVLVIALYVAAGLLEVIGLLLAGLGFKRTWTQFVQTE